MNILKENELQSRKSAEYTVLMGRKRVGKTTLIMMALNFEIREKPREIVS